MRVQDLRELYAGHDWSGVDLTERHEALADEVLALLAPLPGKRVLDLGCGSATLAVELAARGFDAMGLDLTVEVARRRSEARHVSVTLVEGDMAEMTLRDEFDAVVNWDVSGLGLFPTDEENIAVVRRVHEALVPGGKFLVESYNPARARRRGIEVLTYDERRGRFTGTVSRRLPDGRTRTWDLSMRFFSLEEWRRIFADTGFAFLGAWGSMSREPLTDDSKMLVVLGRRT